MDGTTVHDTLVTISRTRKDIADYLGALPHSNPEAVAATVAMAIGWVLIRLDDIAAAVEELYREQ